MCVCVWEENRGLHRNLLVLLRLIVQRNHRAFKRNFGIACKFGAHRGAGVPASADDDEARWYQFTWICIKVCHVSALRLTCQVQENTDMLAFVQNVPLKPTLSSKVTLKALDRVCTFETLSASGGCVQRWEGSVSLATGGWGRGRRWRDGGVKLGHHHHHRLRAQISKHTHIYTKERTLTRKHTHFYKVTSPLRYQKKFSGERGDGARCRASTSLSLPKVSLLEEARSPLKCQGLD